MYKLYLCLQYLVKRVLAYFAMLGVALCVFVMLVCISILTGFVDKIELAAKGLFGDVVVSPTTLSGLGCYDEFIARIKRDVPGVEDASPFILSYGIVRVPGYDQRWLVQVAGIRLPERAAVSDFEEGLFIQKGLARPTFDPPMDLLRRRLAAEFEKTQKIMARERGLPDGEVNAGLIRRLDAALSFQHTAMRRLDRAEASQKTLDDLRKQRAAAEKAEDFDEVTRLDDLIDAAESTSILPPDRRAILGLGIPGLSFRTDRGEEVRTVGPGQQIVLSMIPLGRRYSLTEISPTTKRFTVIDDCDTDVSSIDTEIVYLPFETLQALNNMGAEYAAPIEGVEGMDPNVLVTPARCSQIHVKALPGFTSDEQLREMARRIDNAWEEFRKGNRLARRLEVRAETWRQRQSRLVSTIENQRTLMWIILCIISLVSLVLIFVIMYVIVVQKTRDIGVLKAVGASNSGVAGIFLVYGAAIGLIGSIVGTAGGYLLVRNINPVHDWIGRTFGFVVWNRETFMFAQIPNEVKPATVAWIVGGAVLSGIVGALAPALLAARKQPVEALRYE
jgi:lipoprotein-releasing system permease protein